MKINWSETNGITRGLVAAYPFKEGSGTIIEDLANGNNGTLTNGPTWAGGPFGNSLLFDGSDDHISLLGKSTNLNIGYGTWSAWIKPTILNNGIYHTIVGKSYTMGYWFGLGNGATAEKLQLWVAGSAKATSSSYAILGVWQYYCATWDGSNVKFYFNGSLVETIAETGSPVLAPTINAHIGIDYDLDPSGYQFTGNITNVNIWNRALSASEVARLYADPYIMYRFPDNRWLKSAAIAGIFNKIFFPRQAVNRASTY